MNQMFSLLLLILSFVAFANQSQGKSYSLKELLDTAEQNSLSKKILQLQKQEIKESSGSLDQAYDWTMNAQITTTKDKSPSQNQSLGDQRDIQKAEIGISKMFDTGTILSAKISGQKNTITFPKEESAPTPTPGVPFIPGAELFQPEINPEETNKIELTITQPLWKNYGGKEIELQKEAILSQQEKLSHIDEIELQQLKGQIEQTYWNIIGLESRITTIKKLVEKSKDFVRLTKKRVKIGRADQIDTASAEANLVTNEGTLLKMEIALDSSYELLSHLVFPSQGKDIKLKSKNIQAPELSLPSTNKEVLTQLALDQRADVKKLTSDTIPAYKEYALAKEQDSLSLNGFINISSSGLDGERTEAFEQTIKGKRPTYTIGLQLEKTFGGTNTRSQLERFQTIQKKSALNKSNIEYRIKRDIALALLDRKSADLLRKQAQTHIRSLENQKNIEQQKFRQARAEEISIVRYELEIIGAETELIDADEKQRLAEARLRFLTHSY